MPLMATYGAAAVSWRKGGSLPIQAETTALLARMGTQPGPARRNLINSTIYRLKAAGLWSKIDVLQVYAMHSVIADASLNWKGATATGAASGTVNFVADRGINTSGSPNYYNTNFNPATFGGQYVQTAAHWGLWSRRSVASVSPVAGNTDQSDTIMLWHLSNVHVTSTNCSAGSATGPATDGLGLYISNRTSNSSNVGYKNAVAGTPYTTTNSIAPHNSVITLGKIATAYEPCDIAMFTAGGTLTAGEISAYHTIMRDYMQAVGAA